VKRLLKIFRNIFLTLLALLILLLVLVNMSSVQTYLATRITKVLSERLHTKVELKHVRIDLLNHVLLEGLYVEDQQHDTLAYIGKVQVRMTDWFFLKNGVPVLHYIGLNNAFIHLKRSSKSRTWNYAFIEDAFSSGSTKKDSNPQQIKIDLEKLMLDQVRFHMDDAWEGYDYDIDLGNLTVNVDQLDFDKNAAKVSSILLSESSIRLRDYKGGKPPSPKKPFVIDSTAFNTDNWKLNISKIKFEDCHFRFVSKEAKPYQNEFDPEYIEVAALNTDINDFRVVGDTIRARMDHFSAKERSGFEVKEMQSVISVSPIASICKDLFIQTNNSTISDYYAMHYDRFPDFLDYIAKVRMDVRLKESKVDAKDVAYFAPQLRELPIGLTKISGNAKGTVDHLVGEHLNLTDGFSTVKGNLSIKGLPDVELSLFDFQNAEIFTTGNSVLKYVPSLKNNPNLNLNAISFAYFKGSFTGLLSDFATQGDIKTNLGSLAASIKMKIPEKREPSYTGSISSHAFNVGLLFNQSSLGVTTLNAQLEGASFDAEGFHIKAKSKIQDIAFNGYTYKDIIADGVFDKNKFDGQLLINDSNISMGFYGTIDLNGKDIKLVATANLLSSDLKALHFVEAPTTLTADFDLNCSGKTIDDFIGSAKLYNINLRRHAQRMDLDSINILSYIDGVDKHIDIESNLLSAKINGQFLLSEIPNSMQYYLSKYLPNYIKRPSRIAADQNLNFNINTHEVNDLLLAYTTVLSGFDSSSLSGNLNTGNRTLRLDSKVPFGKIGDVKLYNTVLNGNGNYDKLKLKSSVGSFIVGANVLNTSLSLEAEVGNDSLSYAIATKSEQQYGTATIEGKAYASHDSMFMALAPSEFFINNAKWEIPIGNRVIYAKKYLGVENFILKSGLQKININTENSVVGNPLIVKMNHVDIGQLASLTQAASYRPEGRVNGEVKFEQIFDQPLIKANIEAVGVKLNGDSLGIVKINGSYDGGKQLITLSNNSGIFNDKFSVTTEGSVSFDKQSKDQLDGAVQISNFPIKLLEPILKGYTSQMGGTIDGSVAIKGTVDDPKMNGALLLKNIISKVDYIGALYTIPYGKVLIENQTLKLEDIELHDVYKNTAIASGFVKFASFNNPQINIRLKTDEFEVVNLRDYENDLFYGHVIANVNFSIAGSVSNINMNINATPTQKSQLYLPYNSAGDYSTSTYITFKSFGENILQKKKSKKDKLSVKISAVLNNLMDVTLVLDPKTGDQISANGDGNLSINVPANEEYSMFGTYNIDKGKYLFTYRQVLSKEFIINSGSTISFAGNISNTRLNVNAIYPTTARLYDLLDPSKAQVINNTKEEEDAKATQNVNVKLRMTGTLAAPDLNYEIELPEKRSVGTTAYAELNRINTSDKSALTNQVSSLLFLGSFIPSQGITSTLAVTGAKNTLGETIASQASPLLTSALNKLLGDKTIQVMVQYKSFGQDVNSTTTGAVGATTDSRNQVKFGLKKNYFNDRLSLQVGSAYDWGRPTTTDQSASSFNLAGDFRAQYLINADGGLSLVGFRASNYDLFYGYNIARQGLGITVRKSFDNFYEFIHSKKRIAREKQEKALGVKN
jgi:hypothetical protein